MTRQHPMPRRLVRRLRPAPERFAAAAALQSPGLLMQLQSADEHAEEPSDPAPSPTPLRPRRSDGAAAARRGYRPAATLPYPAQ